MKKYRKEYPDVEAMRFLTKKSGGKVLMDVTDSKKRIISADLEPTKDGFNVVISVRLSKANDVVRNTFHEVTEKRNSLYNFAHDNSGNRIMDFKIISPSKGYTPEGNVKPLNYEQLMENPSIKSEFLRNCVSNLFYNDLRKELENKWAIAKFAHEKGITPKEAALIQESVLRREQSKYQAPVRQGFLSKATQNIAGLVKKNNRSSDVSLGY